MNFDDVLIKPNVHTRFSSRKHVNLNFNPIVASNMDSIGTFEMARVFTQLKCIVILHKYYTANEIISFYNENKEHYKYIGISSGMDTKKLYMILEQIPIEIVCLDIAHGGMKQFIELCKEFKIKYPKIVLIAGNICTYKGYSALSKVNVDIVKAGIGGGSVCSTRTVTGVGYPQLQMILDIVSKRKFTFGKKALLMSDGNCKTPGDICKALVAGADFVMIGGMLSGTDESAGKIINKENKKYKEFYGMASQTALKKHHDKSEISYRAAEGITKLIPCKGPVSLIVSEILGGIRSCCSYIGTNDLKSGKFIKVK